MNGYNLTERVRRHFRGGERSCAGAALRAMTRRSLGLGLYIIVVIAAPLLSLVLGMRGVAFHWAVLVGVGILVAGIVAVRLVVHPRPSAV